MINNPMLLTLVYTLVFVAASFLLREKFPHKYSIGIVLCFFAPAWGHIYVESKYNWVPWMIFMSLERAVVAASEPSVENLIPWLVIGSISSITMVFRISSHKQTPIKCSINIEDTPKTRAAAYCKKIEQCETNIDRDIL